MLLAKFIKMSKEYKCASGPLLVTDESGSRWVACPELQALVSVNEDAVLLQSNLLFQGHSGVHQVLQ